MASCSLTNKAVLSIEDCVTELKRCFLIKKIPINDDCSELHHLEEKLEMTLQVGLKEKPGMFGVKKSYWDYISACFSSSKRLHEGIKFVKSNTELRSSLGRGRALIRFCLTHKCLGDTLQSCFIDSKTTRDFYSDSSLPLQPKLWSLLVTTLYHLNEINFDLNQQNSELDVSWPSFARKLFQSSGLSYITSQDTNLVEVNSELEADVLYLQKKCDSLEKEICCANQEEKETEAVSLVTHNTKSHRSDRDDEWGPTNNNYYHPCSVEDSEHGCSDNTLNFKELNAHNNSSKTQFSCEKCNNHLLNSSISKKDIAKLTDENSLQEYESDVELPTAINMECPPSLIYRTPHSDPALEIKKLGSLHLGLSCATSTSVLCPNNTDSSIPCETFPFCVESYCSINTLVLELKVLIDNLRNSINMHLEDPLVSSYFAHLIATSDSLRTVLQAEYKSLEEYKIPKNNVDEHFYYLKSVALKQQMLIDSLFEKINSSVKENENLYDTMCLLKDKLHSYGLLKVQTMNSSECVNNSFTIKNSVTCHDSNSGYDIDQQTESSECVSSIFLEALHSFQMTSFKLSSLNNQAAVLQLGLDSSQKLSCDLISRVQEQELHMKGITRELEEAHQLLSVMRKQHKKLQSVESVVKYDLQEKRKLLTKLKQQLEETREDSNLVRLKNSKSEVEWQNLRKEFVQRNKQTSEESGFVDDKGIEDPSYISANEYNLALNAPSDKICDIKTIETNLEHKKSRLENLEEQCQKLCANLLHGSKKREEIDCRLESWCKAIENSHKEEELKATDLKYTIENGCNDCSNELTCEKINPDSNSDADSSVSSLEVGSISSDFSSYIPHNSTISSNVCLSMESLKVDQSTISKVDIVTLIEDVECFKIVSNPVEIQVCNDTNFCAFESVEDMSYFDPNDAADKTKKIENSLLPFSEEIVKESNQKEKSKQKEISNESGIAEKESYISVLEDEKRLYQSKFLELETENNKLVETLHHKTDQLRLIQATKEQDISALQFQLNSEVLKYERALKEFSGNNEVLKDMKQKVNDQEELILTLEEALAEIQVEREGEKEHQWEQLEDIQLSLASREEECISLSTELEKLEDFKRYSITNREAMESEVIYLRSDVKELHKKIIKLLKEKDILWKRNDHLTFLQKIQIDDRWMEDREVSKCLGCKNNFSFILRKHHCRHCGRIFCNSCSNNWLLSPSSRKQIRVCNECYVQHLEIKNHVRRDSNVQWLEIDEADESQNLNENTHFISEVHPHTADSIVSLPAFQISNLKHKNHFKSAPELRFRHESFEVPIISSMNNLREVGVIGTTGTLSIKAAEEEVLSFMNEGRPALHWILKPVCEAIAISLIYEDISCGNQQTVLHQSACETEGVIHLSLPGLHKLHFDNRSSATSRMLYYTFKGENEDDEENI